MQGGRLSRPPDEKSQLALPPALACSVRKPRNQGISVSTDISRNPWSATWGGRTRSPCKQRLTAATELGGRGADAPNDSEVGCRETVVGRARESLSCLRPIPVRLRAELDPDNLPPVVHRWSSALSLLQTPGSTQGQQPTPTTIQTTRRDSAQRCGCPILYEMSRSPRHPLLIPRSQVRSLPGPLFRTVRKPRARRRGRSAGSPTCR